MTPQPVLRHAELTGERVLLRPLSLDDVEPAFAMIHGCEDILRWLVWEGPDTPEDLELLYDNWIRKSEEGYDYHFAIVDRKTGAMAGSIGPRFEGHPGQGDVGYWLGVEHWGKGLMTEAVRLVNHLCFEHLATQVMYAYVFVGNVGSRTVLERAGYSYSHLAQAQNMKRGEPTDEWYYTAMRSSWRGGFPDWRPVQQVVELEEPEPAR